VASTGSTVRGRAIEFPPDVATGIIALPAGGAPLSLLDRFEQRFFQPEEVIGFLGAGDDQTAD